MQAVRREGAMITEEHADLQREIALEKDPDKKHLIELKRDIQQADYMALANERVAAMSNLNGDQYKEAMRQQEVWANIATDLRKERLELQERMADQEMDKISQPLSRRTPPTGNGPSSGLIRAGALPTRRPHRRRKRRRKAGVRSDATKFCNPACTCA